MNDIRTYDDLMAEKKRLEAALVVQKGIVREDLIELREEFRPALSLLGIAGKIARQGRTNPLIGVALSLAGEVFLTKLAVSGSGKMVNVIVPFLVKKVSAYFHQKKGMTIFQKLAGAWRRKGHTNGAILE